MRQRRHHLGIAPAQDDPRFGRRPGVELSRGAGAALGSQRKQRLLDRVWQPGAAQAMADQIHTEHQVDPACGRIFPIPGAIGEVLKRGIQTLRFYRSLYRHLPLALFLPGCALIPPLRATPENNAAIVRAAGHCLQAEYELRLNHLRQYEYAVVQLRQRGIPLSSLWGKSLESQLLGVTSNDLEAHDSAVSAVRLHRAAQGLTIAGSAALLGFIWAGVSVMIAADNGAAAAQQVRPLPLALTATGLGLGITSGVLAAVLGKRVDPAVEKALRVYNTHAEAAGCPSP